MLLGGQWECVVKSSQQLLYTLITFEQTALVTELTMLYKLKKKCWSLQLCCLTAAVLNESQSETEVIGSDQCVVFS